MLKSCHQCRLELDVNELYEPWVVCMLILLGLSDKPGLVVLSYAGFAFGSRNGKETNHFKKIWI